MPPVDVGQLIESPHLFITGEDLDCDSDDEDRDTSKKPTRHLTNFYIFNPQKRNKMLSLDALEEDPSLLLEAAGFVKACFDTGEDEGQEDGIEDDVNASGGLQFIKLGPILRFKCTRDNE